MGESLPDDKMPASPISKSYASPGGDLRQWIELFLVTIDFASGHLAKEAAYRTH